MCDRTAVLISFTLALGLPLFACSSSPAPSQSPSPAVSSPEPQPGPRVQSFTAKPLTTYEDPDGRFTVGYPRNWDILEPGETVNCPQEADTVVCFRPRTKDEMIPPAVMRVVVTDAAGSAGSLTEAWNAVRTLVATGGGAPVKTNDQEDTEMAGEPARTAEFDIVIGGIPGNARMTMIYPAPTAYALVGGSPEQNWRDAERVFDDMASTFELG